MEKIEINIKGEDIYNRLYSESGSTSLSRTAMGLPDALAELIQITEDDKRVVDGYITSSVNEVSHTISRYLSPCAVRRIYDETGKDSKYSLAFSLPYNYPKECKKMLEDTIMDVVKNRTMQYWALVVKPDEANIQVAKVQSDVGRLRELLAMRCYPGTADNITEK